MDHRRKSRSGNGILKRYKGHKVLLRYMVPGCEKIAKLLGGDKSVGSVADFDIRGLDYPGSHYEFGACGTGFTAVDGGFGAPFLGQAAHPLVDGFVETQQVAYHPPIQQGTVGVGVG